MKAILVSFCIWYVGLDLAYKIALVVIIIMAITAVAAREPIGAAYASAKLTVADMVTSALTSRESSSHNSYNSTSASAATPEPSALIALSVGIGTFALAVYRTRKHRI